MQDIMKREVGIFGERRKFYKETITGKCCPRIFKLEEDEASLD